MAWPRFHERKQWIVGVYLLAMACCNLALAVRLLPSLRTGYQDFTIYYTGAKLFLEGNSASLYNLDAQYRVQRQFASVPIRHGPLPYNHPPFEALLFVPLAHLNYWPAYLIWTALNLIMLVACAALLRRFSAIRNLRPVLLGLACTAFFPVAIGLIQGQDTILLLLLLVVGLTCWESGFDALAGACMGLGLFRPHMVLPLVLLLAARRARVLMGFVPVAAAVGAVWVAIMGWGGPMAYVRFVLWTERNGAGGFASDAVPNLRGMVYTALQSHAPSSLLLLTVFLSLIVFAIAWYRMRRGNDSPSYSFCLATVVTLLVSFHALAHDATILLPLALFLFGAAMKAERPDRGAQLLSGLLFMAPFYIGLLFRANGFFLVAFIVLWLFVRLLRMQAPAAEPV